MKRIIPNIEEELTVILDALVVIKSRFKAIYLEGEFHELRLKCIENIHDGLESVPTLGTSYDYLINQKTDKLIKDILGDNYDTNNRS